MRNDFELNDFFTNCAGAAANIKSVARIVTGTIDGVFPFRPIRALKCFPVRIT